MRRESFRTGKEASQTDDSSSQEKEMVELPETNSPSDLLHRQIKNISVRMQDIIARTILYPLNCMTTFNKVGTRFTEIQNEAYRSCSDMDKAQTIGMEDKTTTATYALVNTLINLKNEAKQLVEDKFSSDDLAIRFRQQLDNVEQLMNASICPFIEDPSLNGKNGRQALEALERWAELYRHGLKASGDISERGEEWLKEAHQRLDLTAAAILQLDAKNEAIASRVREDAL
jgi:hypothetical protein